MPRKTNFLHGVLSIQPASFVQRFNASHRFDRRLFKQDIAISLAHTKMLHSLGILKKSEYALMTKGLRQVAAEIEAGKLTWQDALEDIHLHIEERLTRKIGVAGKKLHIGRSRNDQSVTGTRLYLRDALDGLSNKMLTLRLALVEQAEKNIHLIMPGFTHLQPAQPISCGHHLMAWYEMLSRDYERMQDCRKRVNLMPLGAAALAGTSIPIDRNLLAQELGFDKPMANSLDAVSSRDFLIEFLAAAAISMQHLSRWAEEVILWCTGQFGFITLPDALCSGSSIMPQKKNPDLAELIRGKSGRIFGNLIALLTLMKGQALAYNKDNQEDKEPLFDTVQTLGDCLSIWEMIVRNMQFNPEKITTALELGYINATCMADYLATKGIAFREAYQLTARLVRMAQKKQAGLAALSLDEMHSISPLFKQDIYQALSYSKIVAEYDHFGGSAPKQVKKAIRAARRLLKKQHSVP